MKNRLLVILGVFIFFQFGYSLSCFFPHYRVIEQSIVFYGGSSEVVMKNADINTFKDLDGFLGKDKNTVYYLGKPLKNIDAATFEIVNRYVPIANDPVWGIGCQTQYITEFKDKNGVYNLEDIKSGKIQSGD